MDLRHDPPEPEQHELTTRDALQNFARIIRSDPRVREAFRQYAPLRVWWRAILALHGKPETLSYTSNQRAWLVARGFEVYAWLYRVIASALMLTALMAVAFPSLLGTQTSSLVFAGSGLMGAYLWLATGLIGVGARAYRTGAPEGADLLCLGLAMLISFLCMAFVIAGALVQVAGWAPTWLDALGVGCLLAFGVGSYVLELTYMLTVRRSTS